MHRIASIGRRNSPRGDKSKSVQNAWFLKFESMNMAMKVFRTVLLLPLVGCLCTVLCDAPMVQADWPEFRGPSRLGLVPAERKLPTVWSPTEHVTWRAELPGQGWSSPIVVGRKIYLTAAIPVAVPPSNEAPLPADAVPPPVDHDLSLLILDADTGRLEQRVDLFRQSATGAPRIHKKNSHASPTPVFDGQHLYIHFGHQGTACTTLDGVIVWRNDTLAFPPVHGNGGSPVVVGSLLIFSRDGADISEVLALDKRTGQVRWTTPREIPAEKRFSFCTPLVIEVAGESQLIFPGSNVVQSLAPESGQEIWRVTYNGYSVIPRPVYAEGLVFICTGYDRPSLLAIDPTGRGDVTATHLRWQTDSNVPNTPSLVSWANRVAMISDRGIATCLDLTTGEEVWKKRIGGNFSASPLLHGTTLYLLSEEGDCTLLDVSGEPIEISRNQISERCLSSLTVVDEDLLLRSENALYRISRHSKP